jgi:DMSO/TMAO reductase YedYZ molybdopterin-dependent catalytic subunit
VRADFHCVTTWSRFDTLWEGVLVSDVMKRVRIRPEARFVMAHSYGGYSTNLPLEDFLREPNLFAYRVDGADLSAEHGGPCRLVVHHLYAWKSAKWVRRIELMAADRLGFWEGYGYHPHGDPWTEERFG